MSNTAMHALWAMLAAQPSEIAAERSAVAPASVVRDLIYWNDRGNVAPNEYGTDAECKYSMLRSIAAEISAGDSPAGPTLLSLFDDAQAHFQQRGYCGGTQGDAAVYSDADELACLLDPERLDEAADMVDHWRDRCSLPEAIADALMECVQTNYAILNR